jgi:hypothetical protein
LVIDEIPDMELIIQDFEDALWEFEDGVARSKGIRI